MLENFNDINYKNKIKETLLEWKNEWMNECLWKWELKLSFDFLCSFQLLFYVEEVCMAKKLNASQAFDDTWSTAADLENELEVGV